MKHLNRDQIFYYDFLSDLEVSCHVVYSHPARITGTVSDLQLTPTKENGISAIRNRNLSNNMI